MPILAAAVALTQKYCLHVLPLMLLLLSHIQCMQTTTAFCYTSEGGYARNAKQYYKPKEGVKLPIFLP